MRKLLALAFISLGIFLSNCSDSSDTIHEAQLFSVDQIKSSPGYSWFVSVYDLYEPDSLIVEQIKQAFDASTHRFFYFVQPSCSCRENEKSFAQLAKTIHRAGIDDSYTEIYSMNELNYTYPYSHKFTLEKLPSYFIMNINDTIPVYSIMENLDRIRKDFPDSTVTVEQLALEGLSI